LRLGAVPNLHSLTPRRTAASLSYLRRGVSAQPKEPFVPSHGYADTRAGHKRHQSIASDIKRTQAAGYDVERSATISGTSDYASPASVENQCHAMLPDARIRRPRKIRFSDDEWDVIVDRARLCGRAPARYVRETALGATPRATRTQATAPVIHQLGRLGNQLRQLSDRLTERGELASATEVSEALGEVLGVVRHLD
jgi:hypothetical protein